MKYKKFVIKNYKAIEYIEVPMSNSTIPLIGINESGKTSILNAILAFDSNKDSLMNGEHINVKNRYKTSQQNCSIIAYVTMNDDEFEDIGKQCNLDMGSELYGWLNDKIKNRETIGIERIFENNSPTKNYKIIDIDIEDKKLDKVVKSILRKLPNILYFDDFSDRVPDNITFSASFAKDGKYTARGTKKEWQEIINEIFIRAIDGELSLRDFLNLDDEDEQENYLNDVNQTLNEIIIDEWEELKNSLSSGSDSVLDLKLRHTKENDEHKFEFKVTDKENDRNRVFNISDRSKGFQWFFNFNMKLKFNPKYKTHPDNAIYLLDEPGSYLHASAQTELLKKLCEIAKSNTIIYCTHSQYLLDPDVINIGSIRIVEKRDGKIVIENYGNSDVNKSEGTFSALNDALQLKFGMHTNEFKKVIITEGIVDYYFLKLFINVNDITIIPGAGAGNLKDLISIMIGCSEKFLVILDNDMAGRQARSEYKTYFDEDFNSACYQYEGIGERKNSFEIEDILSEEDIATINTTMNMKDIKKAITSLYYSDDKTKQDICDNLSKETKDRMDIFKRKIELHFS